MATIVRDPREVVTPDAFRVADHLIGIPLAKPWRRLWAMLVDLLLVAILIKLLDALALLIALGGAFLVFRITRGGSGRWYRRFFRRGLGCFGAFLAFVVILVAWNLIAGVFDADDDRGPTVTADSTGVQVENLGFMASARMLRDGAALRSATRPGQQDTLATRLVEGLVEQDFTPEQLRAGARDLRESEFLPRNSAAALDAAIETTSARLERRAPRSPAEARAADSLALAAAAAGGAASQDSATAAGGDRAEAATLAAADDSIESSAAGPVDSTLAAKRDSIGVLRNQLRETRASLASERERREAAQARLQDGAFRWMLSSVAEEAGLGLGWLGLYFVAFTVLGGGQTPGKRLFRLRIIRLDGKPLGWWTALQRFGGYSASVFTGLLGFAEMFWDDNRQALQDKLVHTVVVQEHRDGRAGAALDLPPGQEAGARPSMALDWRPDPTRLPDAAPHDVPAAEAPPAPTPESQRASPPVPKPAQDDGGPA